MHFYLSLWITNQIYTYSLQNHCFIWRLMWQFWKAMNAKIKHQRETFFESYFLMSTCNKNFNFPILWAVVFITKSWTEKECGKIIISHKKKKSLPEQIWYCILSNLWYSHDSQTMTTDVEWLQDIRSRQSNAKCQ